MSYCDGCRFAARSIIGWESALKGSGYSRHVGYDPHYGPMVCTNPNYAKIIPPRKLAHGSTKGWMWFPILQNLNPAGRCELYETSTRHFMRWLMKKAEVEIRGEPLDAQLTDDDWIKSANGTPYAVKPDSYSAMMPF